MQEPQVFFLWIRKLRTFIDDLNQTLKKVVLVVDDGQEIQVIDDHVEHDECKPLVVLFYQQKFTSS